MLKEFTKKCEVEEAAELVIIYLVGWTSFLMGMKVAPANLHIPQLSTDGFK